MVSAKQFISASTSPHVFCLLCCRLPMGCSPSRKSLLQCGCPTGCRGLSAPAVEATPPHPPSLALASAGLFLTLVFPPPLPVWHFYPFLSTLSPRCHHRGWGVHPAVGRLEMALSAAAHRGYPCHRHHHHLDTYTQHRYKAHELLACSLPKCSV